MQNWELSKDGKIVCYDMTQMIEKEAFQTLKDINVFMDTCTVLNDTLAWDICKNRDNKTKAKRMKKELIQEDGIYRRFIGGCQQAVSWKIL